MRTRRMAAVLAAACGSMAACASVSLSSEMDLKTGLVGADYWAGLRRHPAQFPEAARPGSMFIQCLQEGPLL